MARLKSSVGLWLQRLYQSAPVGWRMRLAAKDWVFRHFTSVFRNTNAYRRWQLFGAGRQHVVPQQLEASSFATTHGQPSANKSHARYLADLFSRGFGQRDPAYAALTNAGFPRSLRAKAIAFYLPQFHPIAENDEWWGRGFTEWTNVSRALPQYVGHDQPHLPGELGFYDLRIVDVMRRQAELAKLYGVHGFCFHHYWFSGRRLLERPLDQLIAHPDIDLPFCLCWANENWTRRWDGHDDDVLLGQSYTAKDDLQFISDLVPYLKDSRYIRIDGRLLLIVYRPSLLPDCQQTIRIWRDYCREQGLGELFLAMVQFDVDDPRIMGFDAAIEFPPHKLARGLPSINHKLEMVNPEYSGYVVDYRELAERGRTWPVPEYPLFKGVAPRWDNEARKPGNGYTFANSTPAYYREWLGNAVDYARGHPVGGESVLFLNAWNEWAEGAHLEPDRRFGYAYLQATRDVLAARDFRPRVLVVSHDAHPHGAQYLALNLVRELVQGCGAEVEVLLQDGGMLEADFAKLAKLHKPYETGEDVVLLATKLRLQGIDLVIANTAVAGRIAGPLRAAGLRIVSLVHELPGVIREYGLEHAMASIAANSDRIVVAADAVQQGLAEFIDADIMKTKLVKRPQGLFTRSRYRALPDQREARANLRRRLGLPASAAVVLAVGYADRRKGVDMLVKIAALVCGQAENIHFVWVGHRDVGLEKEVEATLRAGGCQANFHFMGMDFDTDDYYAGADVYALASREDPFPSVVLESMAVGTPVVAFAGTGGGADLAAATAGITVPAFDLQAYANALLRLIRDKGFRDAKGKAGEALIESDFSFRSYAIDLLSLGGVGPPKVSVVVPNYNYAHYLVERLASVSSQTLPVYEIIVLDDASTDGSVDALTRLRASVVPEPRIVTNAQNSGSVFRQWLKGVELARGEYVWIAEADDLSKPDFLESMVRRLEGDPQALFGYCQSEQIDEYGQVLAPDYLAYTDDLSRTHWSTSFVAEGASEVRAGLAIKNTIPNVSAVLFRRQALLDVLKDNIEEIAGYRIAGDWLVYLMLLRSGKIAFEANSHNKHRRHASSVTIGSAAGRHYEEVTRVQHAAQMMFTLDAASLSSAARYAGELRKHFGLSEERQAEVR